MPAAINRRLDPHHDVGKVLGAFFSSGVIHSAASITINGGNILKTGEFIFFFTNGVAVVVSLVLSCDSDLPYTNMSIGRGSFFAGLSPVCTARRSAVVRAGGITAVDGDGLAHKRAIFHSGMGRQRAHRRDVVDCTLFPTSALPSTRRHLLTVNHFEAFPAPEVEGRH